MSLQPPQRRVSSRWTVGGAVCVQGLHHASHFVGSRDEYYSSCFCAWKHSVEDFVTFWWVALYRKWPNPTYSGVRTDKSDQINPSRADKAGERAQMVAYACCLLGLGSNTRGRPQKEPRVSLRPPQRRVSSMDGGWCCVCSRCPPRFQLCGKSW